MWFLVAAFYSWFGYDADPEGILEATTGLLVVGPVLSGLFTWGIESRYWETAVNNPTDSLLQIVPSCKRR